MIIIIVHVGLIKVQGGLTITITIIMKIRIIMIAMTIVMTTMMTIKYYLHYIKSNNTKCNNIV